MMYPTTRASDYLGFWYQKIARATKANVMIQRTMSLARFFSLSSAIGAVQHTRKSCGKCPSDFALLHGFEAAVADGCRGL